MSKPTPQTRVQFAHTLTPMWKRVFSAFWVLIFLTSVISITRAGTPVVHAAAPATLNFQARLLSSTGSLVPDGDYNIEFKIYNASSSSGSSQGSCTGDANCLWTETRTGGSLVQVKNGYMSAYLGDTNPLPANIWDQQLYLTMNIGGVSGPTWDGEMTPRIRLTSVPYAFRATVAESAEILQKNTGSFTGTVDFATMTADRKFLFPDTSLATTASPGTICVFNGAASNCPAASGSAYYIQNDTVLQTQSNFNIQARDSGVNGTIGGIIRGAAAGQTVDLLQFQASGGSVLGAVTSAGNLQVASSVDVRSAGTLSVGTSTATAITLGKTGITTTNAGALTVTEAFTASSTAQFNDNVTVAAGKTIRLVGDITANRPVSPTEGMVYFDTTTKQLIVYANGKWQGDRSISTKIIAPSNASQTAKDSADVVLTGTADQTLINTALTAAAGGKVYILEGTVTVTGSISIPNNTTLAGAGRGTLITIPNGLNANTNAIINTDTTTGTGITIRDLRLDGNKANQSGSVGMSGIALIGATLNTVTNVQSNNWYLSGAGTAPCYFGSGICISSSTYNTLNTTTTVGNNFGIIMAAANFNTLTGNVAQGNAVSGIAFSSAGYSTVTGNVTNFNTLYGIQLSASTHNTIGGNLLYNNGSTGIFLSSSSDSNSITGNKLSDNGGATTNNAIYINASDSNNVTGNNIGDTSATTNNYAINIFNSTSDTNYLSDNILGTGTINNIGTGTIFGGQSSGGAANQGNYVIQPAGTIELMKDTNVTGTLSASVSVLTPALDRATAGTLTIGTTTATAITLGKVGVTTTSAGALTSAGLFTGQAGATVSGGAISLTGNTASGFTTSAGALTLTSAVASTWSTTAGNLTIQAGSGTVSLGTSSNLVSNGALTITSGGATGFNIDTGGAATLTVGVTNANAVSISKTGVITTVNGSLTVAEGLTVSATGNVAFQRNATDISAVGSLTDLNIGTGALFRFTGATTQTLNSIANPADGRIITLINAAANALVITNDTGVTAANRIITGTGGSLSVPAGASVQLAYDSAASRWRVIGSSAAAGGAGVNTVGTFSGTSIANGASISGTTITFGPADGTNPGMVTTGTQTFAGDKTFTGLIQGNAGATVSGGAISLTGNAASSLTTSAGALTLTSNQAATWSTTNGNLTIQAGSGVVSFGSTTSLTATGALGLTSGGATIMSVDSGGAAALNLGTTNANAVSISRTGMTTTVNGALTVTEAAQFNDNVTVAAGKYLKLTGGNTASRPGSPTEGMLYFDTTTKQLRIYANGKWQADRSDVITVAASNSSQTEKDSADYVADGNTGTAADGDQIQINAALTAGSGKKVYLFAGTYVADETILIPNNTTLAGAGRGTLIELADIDATDNLIENTDTTTGTGVVIQDFQIDGRKDLNTAGAQRGIYLNAMGDYATARQGGKLTNLWTNNFRNEGIWLNNSDLNVLTGNTSQNNTNDGFVVFSSSNNILTGNIAQSNANDNFYLESSTNNTLTGNTAQGGSGGFTLATSSNYNTVTGNTAQAATKGILLNSSSSNVISSNNIYDSGGSTTNDGIYLNASDSNNITSNLIGDTSASSNNYAINIFNSTSDNNYLSNNTLGTGTVNNTGTGTIFGGQSAGGNANQGNYTIQPAGSIELIGNTNVTGTLSASTSVLTPLVGRATAGTLSIGTDANSTAVTISRTGVATSVAGALNVAEATQLSGGLTVTNGGNVAFQKGSDYNTVGITNNVDLGTGTLFRLTGVSAQTITGLANGADGRIITLVNAGSTAATISNNSGSSLAANRILTGTGGDIILPAGASVQLAYDSSALVWRVIGSAAAANGYIQLQSGTPGTAQTGNFNISGTGIAATSLLTPTLDSPSGTTTLNIGTTNATSGINLNQNTSIVGNLTLTQGADRTLSVGARTGAGVGYNLTVAAGAANGANNVGGGLLLQGGAAVAGNANGGSVTIAGGAGFGTGTQGLVNLSTTAFTSSAVQTYSVTGVNNIAAGLVDQFSTIPVNTTATSVIVSVPDPAQNTVIGRVLYISARDNALDFTLRLNAGGTPIDIAMKENSTATLIWNGDEWTAAGASSSTDLQSAYNNTLTSAGGAEILLNPVGGAADGFTIRNNGTTPIIGGLLEVQSSIGSNLLSVNNNATEYATNGGAETPLNIATPTSFPANTWDATTGGTVDRWNTVGDFVATGVASARVQTTTTNHGLRNRLSSTLTSGMTYSVSFAVRGSASFSTLQVLYSPDGTTSGTTTCITGQTVTTGSWTRVLCTFVASGTITSSNSILIRQTDATARTFYVDNLSVSVNANMTFAADGSVESALGINWTQYDADGGAGTTTVTRTTVNIYDTTGAVQDVTTAHVSQGVRNNMPVVPSVNTKYLVSFYAKATVAMSSSLKVGFLPAGGSGLPVTAQECVDYSTQSVTTTGWTKITCLITTPASGISDPDLVIYQTDATARTIYIDALTINLNNNNSNNVQIGGANKGGPTTLLTVDRASSAPIAANNDAYLGSMYYDTTTGRIQCYEADGWGACGSSPDNIITLTPEYTGAVLGTPGNASGLGNVTAGIGVLTADFCSNETGVLVTPATGNICANHEARNFYRWTSPQATQQVYSIYVSYKLPTTFKQFNDSNTIKLTALSDNLTNGVATLQVFRKKSDGTAVSSCGGAQTINTSINTWQQQSYDAGDETICGFQGGDNIVFKIDVKSQSNGNIYIENMDFVFTNN